MEINSGEVEKEYHPLSLPSLDSLSFSSRLTQSRFRFPYISSQVSGFSLPISCPDFFPDTCILVNFFSSLQQYSRLSQRPEYFVLCNVVLSKMLLSKSQSLTDTTCSPGRIRAWELLSSPGNHLLVQRLSYTFSYFSPFLKPLPGGSLEMMA